MAFNIRKLYDYSLEYNSILDKITNQDSYYSRVYTRLDTSTERYTEDSLLVVFSINFCLKDDENIYSTNSILTLLILDLIPYEEDGFINYKFEAAIAWESTIVEVTSEEMYSALTKIQRDWKKRSPFKWKIL